MSKPTHTHCPSRHNTGILEILLGAALLCFCGVAFSQEKADLDAANRIRDAALNHSQIMEMVEYRTDVTGPRLTGSPNLKKAEEYARDRLGQWGLANAHLEAWGPFGCGWSLEGFTANMLSPALARSSPILRLGAPARTALYAVKLFFSTSRPLPTSTATRTSSKARSCSSHQLVTWTLFSIRLRIGRRTKSY